MRPPAAAGTVHAPPAAPAAAASGSPTIATSSIGPSAKSSAISDCAAAIGESCITPRIARRPRSASSRQRVVAGQFRQPQQAGDRHRAAARRRAVVLVLQPHDEVALPGRRGEEAAGRIGEAVDHDAGQVLRGPDPADVERRLVQIDKGVDQEGVILEVGVDLRRPSRRPWCETAGRRAARMFVRMKSAARTAAAV